MAKYSTRASIFILLVIANVGLLYLYYQKDYKLLSTPTAISTNATKTILYYTPFWTRKDYFIGTGWTPFKNCAYKNCYGTYDKSYMPIEKFDLLIFHGILQKKHIPQPAVRNPSQIYVYMNIEAPLYICPPLKPYKSYYNWTMSHRFDSDIVRRHASIVKSNTNYKYPRKEDLAKKTKLIAWFVSHCKTSSRRELLAKEIQKYVPVDIYGKCGKLYCSHRKNNTKLSSEDCYDMVEKQYKFYLSFENSYCKDYSTEKLYNVLKRNIVPIVYGAGNYSLSAPPHSVINVADFPNVSELVEYLNYLDKNDDKYLEYFDWKKDFIITSNDAACQICRKLHQPATTKIYDDLHTWWWGINKSNCKDNKNLPKIVSDLI